MIYQFSSGHLSEGEKKSLIRKDICTSMFTVALFTVAKIWEAHKAKTSLCQQRSGAREDSCGSLRLQGDQTSQS